MVRTTKPKPNISLLRRIQKAILKYPDQFNMNWWFQEADSRGQTPGRCGTAACIAGWGVALSRKFNGKKLSVVRQMVLKPAEEAARLLRIPLRTRNLGGWIGETTRHPLFYYDQWPAKFKKAYIYAGTAREAAQAASDRIDHLIKTGK